MMTLKKDYAGIDIFRFIAAIFVIAIHTAPLADLSSTAEFVFTGIICRVAVPFFLITSGFFLVREDASYKKLLSFIKKTAVIYLISIVLYIPINVYMGYFSMENAVFEIVKDIFFDGTLYHLWYLPAAITGGAIAFFLVKKLGTKWAAAITLLLYLLGMVGDSLFGLIEATPAGAVYNAVFAVVGSSRNGIFFTPIFFVLGAIIAKREPLSLKKSLLGAVISYILLFFEAMALRDAALFRRDSMCIFIFLLPLIYFLFSALCGVKGERKALLRDSSMIIYIIHPFVIVVLRFVSELLGIDGVIIENNLVNFFTVTVLSVIAAFVISAVMGLFKKNGARKREETAKEQEKEPVAEPV